MTQKHSQRSKGTGATPSAGGSEAKAPPRFALSAQSIASTPLAHTDPVYNDE